MLDACRLLAVAGIVWMHTCADDYPHNAGNLGRLGVPFFSAAAVFMLVAGLRRRPDTSFSDYAKKRLSSVFIFPSWHGALFIWLPPSLNADGSVISRFYRFIRRCCGWVRLFSFGICPFCS